MLIWIAHNIDLLVYLFVFMCAVVSLYINYIFWSKSKKLKAWGYRDSILVKEFRDAIDRGDTTEARKINQSINDLSKELKDIL